MVIQAQSKTLDGDQDYKKMEAHQGYVPCVEMRINGIPISAPTNSISSATDLPVQRVAGHAAAIENPYTQKLFYLSVFTLFKPLAQ
jgi:hypothetical protein